MKQSSDNIRYHGGFDQFASREQKRLDDTILNDLVVKSLDDIKRVIANLNNRPEHAVVEVKSNIDSSIVTASTKSRSPYSIIYEGLLAIKNKDFSVEDTSILVNGISVSGSKIRKPSEAWNSVDQYIKRYAGGKRDGYLILWELGEYKYRYDIFTHKLTKSAAVSDL